MECMHARACRREVKVHILSGKRQPRAWVGKWMGEWVGEEMAGLTWPKVAAHHMRVAWVQSRLRHTVQTSGGAFR